MFVPFGTTYPWYRWAVIYPCTPRTHCLLNYNILDSPRSPFCYPSQHSASKSSLPPLPRMAVVREYWSAWRTGESRPLFALPAPGPNHPFMKGFCYPGSLLLTFNVFMKPFYRHCWDIILSGCMFILLHRECWVIACTRHSHYKREDSWSDRIRFCPTASILCS